MRALTPAALLLALTACGEVPTGHQPPALARDTLATCERKAANRDHEPMARLIPCAAAVRSLDGTCQRYALLLLKGRPDAMDLWRGCLVQMGEVQLADNHH